MTAVEWLENMIAKMEAYGGDLPPLMIHIQKAKEMEKEQGYSEEDMAESFMACWKANVPEGFECKLSFKEWFEQFKKEQNETNT